MSEWVNAVHKVSIDIYETESPKKRYPPEWENQNMEVSKSKYFTSGLKAPLSKEYFYAKKCFKLSKFLFYEFYNLN